MSARIQVVIACEDPTRLAEFWSSVLGYILQPPPDGFQSWDDFADSVGIPESARNDISAAVDPEGVGPRLLFERYDGGPPNQRVHIDVNTVGGSTADVDDAERRRMLESERERIEALGGSFRREAVGMAGEVWIEMFDPEGNWFCVQ